MNISKTKFFILIYGIAFFLPACGLEQAAPLPENTEAIMKQMRWSLEDTTWDWGLASQPVINASSADIEQLVRDTKRSGSGNNLHRTVEELILKGDEASRQRANEILQKLVELHDTSDFRSVVTTHGIEYAGISQRQESGGKVLEAELPNPQRPTVLNVRDLAYEYAALYLLTGERRYAEKSRDILLRFAEVAPEWPLYDRKNKAHTQSDAAYLKKGDVNGLWSVWTPLDMGESLPMLKAYDIIRPILTPEEKTTIREKFFVHQKELIDRFEFTHQYHNLMSYRLAPLIQFGKVLERPDYVHEAVNYWKNLLNYSYTADGFWKEVTPAYHQQVSARLVDIIPHVVKGYSDPQGYAYKDGKRFDNLDLWDMARHQLRQMKNAIHMLAMPDCTYVAINDTWPTKKDNLNADADRSTLDKPGLLGIAGVAKLGAKGMVSFLQFDGIRGHDHHDALNLVWFAGGREVFSDTGYQALPDSGSTREWHTISASHNTVAVNEETQFQNRERFIVPSSGGPLTTHLPDADKGSLANQGRLLVWRADSETAQAMEAEQENAYGGVTSLFRRTIVMVPYGDGDGYLVDIFRIRGGLTHDFFLRGGLDEPYTMKFDANLQPASGTLYKYIQLQQSAEIRPPLLATVQYPDGYEVRSLLSDVFGSEDASLQLLVGEAPAIRRLGTATFSLIRHQIPKGVLETCYVWVHEAGRQKKIRAVKTWREGMNVILSIEREDRTDYVFSGKDDVSHFEFDGWNFTGRLAFANTDSGIVFSGSNLERNKTTIAKASPSITGSVIETTRLEAGDSTDSLLIKPDASIEGLLPHLVHVDFGSFIRFSIPVKKAIMDGENLRLELAHSPGFVLKDGQTLMTNSPGWAYAGIPTVRVDCKTPSGP